MIEPHLPKYQHCPKIKIGSYNLTFGRLLGDPEGICAYDSPCRAQISGGIASGAPAGTTKILREAAKKVLIH